MLYKLEELESYNPEIEKQKSSREIFFLSIETFNQLCKKKK